MRLGCGTRYALDLACTLGRPCAFELRGYGLAAVSRVAIRSACGVADGSPTARSRLVAKPRAPGGAMLTGFSCESGSLVGVWDKPCGPRVPNADALAGRRTARAQQPFVALVGGGFAKPGNERTDF